MDSGLGSDDEKRNRTKAQKQLQNEQKQLFSSCFIDATSLGDEEEFEHRRNDERRQGALVFRSSIPQYSMLQMPHSETESDHGSMSDAQDDKADAHSIDFGTPHNSIVQVEAEAERKTPIGFYVDLGEIEVVEQQPTAPPEKKNIFSMVIDFNVPKRDMPTRLSTSLYGRKKSASRSCTLRSSSSHSSEEVRGSCENVSRSDSQTECENNINGDSSTNPALMDDEETVMHNGDPDGSSVNLNISERNQENGEDLEKVESKDEVNKGNKEEIIKDVPKPVKQFVKLSDLEEQSPRLDLFLAPRMSRSIPEKSWVESPLATFHSASYRSSPQSFQSDLNDPPDAVMTDSSTLAPRRSVQRLGTDLLRMFLEEIGPDVTLDINGRKLRAHKCILSSRCQYFAAVFGGKCSENIVSIQGYSYAAVHFALCHIYSGAAYIPQSISLVELAALSDLLGLEGLKEVVAHALKVRHCHNFHQPCVGCITGVTEVLPLTAAYGLDELYQTSLSWITKHFTEVWPNRSFANLPKELRDKCHQQHVVHMTPDTVLNTILSTDKLLATMPTAKWAEAIAQLTLQLADHCQIYLRQNFSSILSSSRFLTLDIQVDLIGQLEEGLLSASGALKLDQACRSYIICHKMLQKPWSNASFVNVLRKIYSQVEGCVLRQAAQVSRHSLWMQLDPALRKRIRDLNTVMSRTKAEVVVNPLSSSSDSSRNSSPAVKNGRTQLHSPSLRRSLLMAAKSSQIPSSPSTFKRVSTLTNPTQSSAAKNTTKNLSSQRLAPVKPKGAPIVQKTSVNMNTKSSLSSSICNAVIKKTVQTKNVTSNIQVNKRQSSNIPTKISATQIDKVSSHNKQIHNSKKPVSTSHKPPVNLGKQASSPFRQTSSPHKQTSSPYRQTSSPHKQISSPQKQASSPRKQTSSPQKQASSPLKQSLSPNKQAASPCKQLSPHKQSPRVVRSSTFLKDEPTVLKKV